MRTVRLLRTVYKTDATDDEPEYVGTQSDPIPAPDQGVNAGWRIVGVDWSKRGEVEVTWLVPND